MSTKTSTLLTPAAIADFVTGRELARNPNQRVHVDVRVIREDYSATAYIRTTLSTGLREESYEEWNESFDFDADAPALPKYEARVIARREVTVQSRKGLQWGKGNVWTHKFPVSRHNQHPSPVSVDPWFERFVEISRSVVRCAE